MIRHVRGDLLQLAEDGEFDLIAHGCNCFHMMGAGIAGQIARKYPAAYDADKNTIYGDPKKLGTISFAPNDANVKFYIANMYTQFHGGRCDNEILYPSIRSCFKRLDDFRKDGQSVKIGIPMIGSGIAGGNWDDILDIISQEMYYNDLTIVEWG